VIGLHFSGFVRNLDKTFIHIRMGYENLGNARVWLRPVSIKYLIGFNPAEEKTILETIMVNLRSFNTQWDEHFN
jgi:hypothetical protein